MRCTCRPTSSPGRATGKSRSTSIERSAEAALEQSGDLVQTHYAHAIDYMVYGHLQLGEPEEAARLVDEMMRIDNHQVSFGGAYALAASPVRLLLEQEKWAEAAALAPEMHPAIPVGELPPDRRHALVCQGSGRGSQQ